MAEGAGDERIDFQQLTDDAEGGGVLEGAYCAGAHAHHQVLEVERRSVLGATWCPGASTPSTAPRTKRPPSSVTMGSVPLLDRLMNGSSTVSGL